MKTIFLPIVLGVVGYLLKSFYELYIDRQKRKTNQIEEKLKNFYWPILTRLEQNRSVWEMILQKRNDRNSIEQKIGNFVETNIIIKNHKEIMDIILKNRFLAKFDTELSKSLSEYFRHIAIYEGILFAEENVFPGDLGAFYPNQFDEIVTKRTIDLQMQLDHKSFV